MSRFHELKALNEKFALELNVTEADILHAAAIVGTDPDRVRKFLTELVVQRTLAAATPPHGDWRPIDTAAKDGTRILLFRGTAQFGLNVIIGWWNSDTARPYWSHDAEAEHGSIEARKFQPTHWMPLPTVPTGATSNEVDFVDEHTGVGHLRGFKPR